MTYALPISMIGLVLQGIDLVNIFIVIGFQNARKGCDELIVKVASYQEVYHFLLKSACNAPISPSTF